MNEFATRKRIDFDIYIPFFLFQNKIDLFIITNESVIVL